MSRLREEDDPYVVEEPSDEERALSSSEDEVDVLLHGTPDQKRKLIRECLTGESESSSDDEFQKEMEAELNTTMKTMEGKWKSPEMDTQDVRKNRKHQQRRILSNDELLYDPEEDSRDQEWVDSQRRGYRNQRRAPQQRQAKPAAVPNSDAVLNCPACMTTLCLDCQRHESYKTQYRAMFVMNCVVNKEEILKYRKKVKRSKKRKHSKEIDSIQSNQEEEEIYHPVLCTECSTEVAVMDKDEVFHFFNVLASHS
uniref:E2F-associated phosphoprotein isoform X2 n=1 Tax=Agelaius phoeniceus TaxID=39638 RepID=UPI0023EB525A|nr:E2F-associated phosphoprotein isoform X2 [Agelaius phoeniceus]